MPAVRDRGPVYEATFQDGRTWEYTGAHVTHDNTEAGLVPVVARRELPVGEASVGNVVFRYPAGEDPAEYYTQHRDELGGPGAPEAGETREEKRARLRTELDALGDET